MMIGRVAFYQLWCYLDCISAYTRLYDLWLDKKDRCMYAVLGGITIESQMESLLLLYQVLMKSEANSINQ